MANAHEQIDTIITTNTLKDFLTSAMQDETFAAGRVNDPLRQLQSNQWKVSNVYNPTSPKSIGLTPYKAAGVPEWTKQSRESLDRIKHMKNLEALKHSPSRQANLSNLNMKKLPGGIDIGTGIRPAFGGALTAAITLAPLLQELIYKGMGLDPSGLEDEEPWFNPEGSSYETKYSPIPQRIESIPPKDIDIR